MSTTSFAPRINHVAISVDADVLDDQGRAALLDFYSEVFGWTEGDNSTEKGNPLILVIGAISIICFCWFFGAANLLIHLLMTATDCERAFSISSTCCLWL